MTTHESPAKRLLSQSAAERKQQQHDAEIGVKVIATLTLWHENTILPLEQRVALLEQERAAWRRWWDRLRAYRQRDTEPETDNKET